MRLITPGVLIAVVLFAPSATAPAAEPAIEDYLTPDALMVTVFRDRQVLGRPSGPLIPIELFAKDGLAPYFGTLGHPNTTRTVAVLSSGNGMFLTAWGKHVAVYAESDQEWSLEDLAESSDEASMTEIAGQPAVRRRLQSGKVEWIVRYRPNCLLISQKTMIERVLRDEQPAYEGNLQPILDGWTKRDDLSVAIDIEMALRPFLPLIKEFRAKQEAAGEKPPATDDPIVLLARAALLTRVIEARVNIDGGLPTSYRLHALRDAEAPSLARLIDSLNQLAQDAAGDFPRSQRPPRLQLEASPLPTLRALGKYYRRLEAPLNLPVDVTVNDGVVTLYDTTDLPPADRAQAQFEMNRAVASSTLRSVARGLWLSDDETLEYRTRRVAKGLHEYAKARQGFPPHAIYGRDGKPLLSWRVAILPFLDQEKLYQEFRLDEPWDSAHNQKLVERMPMAYRRPHDEDQNDAGRTQLLGVVGPEYFFRGDRQSRKRFNVLAGGSNPIAIVRVTGWNARPWTAPEDWTPSVGGSLPLAPTAHAGRANGESTVLPKDLTPERLFTMLRVPTED